MLPYSGDPTTHSANYWLHNAGTKLILQKVYGEFSSGIQGSHNSKQYSKQYSKPMVNIYGQRLPRYPIQSFKYTVVR